MEPFDFSMPTLLAQHRNVHSQMFTDHAHYIIPGGENYTKGFTAWDVYRGQEGDPVWVRPDKNGIRSEHRPAWFKGTFSEAEAENRSHFKTEYEYPSVRTLYGAAKWLEENHDADNFLLWRKRLTRMSHTTAPNITLIYMRSRATITGMILRTRTTATMSLTMRRQSI